MLKWIGAKIVTLQKTASTWKNNRRSTLKSNALTIFRRKQMFSCRSKERVPHELGRRKSQSLTDRDLNGLTMKNNLEIMATPMHTCNL
jgi:hypothetical protein